MIPKRLTYGIRPHSWWILLSLDARPMSYLLMLSQHTERIKKVFRKNFRLITYQVLKLQFLEGSEFHEMKRDLWGWNITNNSSVTLTMKRDSLNNSAQMLPKGSSFEDLKKTRRSIRICQKSLQNQVCTVCWSKNKQSFSPSAASQIYLYNIQHIFKYINLHEREKNNNVLLTLKAQIFFLLTRRCSVS